MKIAFCAGHGMYTAGKRSPEDEREWSFNNKVALAFEKEMETYEGVELLRTDDRTGKTDVPLKTRTDKANAWGADIYISFHHNANTSKWGTWTGVETFTYLGSQPKSEKLAAAVHPYVVEAYGLKDRGIKKGNLHIVRETKMPAILIEGGFMDSTNDIKKLRDDNVLANAGKGVATGVAKYAGLTKKKETATASTEDKSIGTITVLVDALNVRAEASFTSKIVKVIKKGEKYKAYSEKNGLYNVGGNQWTSANPKYVKFEKKETQVVHTVVKGETLWGISQKYDVTVDSIKSKNGLKTDVLSIGQKLIIK